MRHHILAVKRNRTMTNETIEWIVSDPEVLGGKPRIRDTRITVEFVLELLASGGSREEIGRAYPHVPTEGLAAAIEYAARALKNEVVWDVTIPA
jgi:uncharacterized protein (DUF433 family)